MSKAHSTPAYTRSKATGATRPSKPCPEFPLFPHAAGYWAKKIRGKMHYFGPWADPDAALTKYLEQRDALHSGRVPRPDPDALRVKDACNAFLNAKQALVDGGELSSRTWADYKAMTDELVAHLGKGRLVADLAPDDFASLRSKLSRKWGPHRLGKAIQAVRSVFKHALDAGLIASPVRFGPGFKRPSKKTVRLHRAGLGLKLFTREEVRKLIDAAGPALRAMLFLGINCGFGNADCGNLPLSAVDLEAGWMDFPRPKTGVQRRSPLWPETVAAIREYLAHRVEPKGGASNELVFVTKHGQAWAKKEASATNPLSAETAKLMRDLGIGGRPGVNYYALRHTFRTIGDEAKDQPAADLIMGHESPHMSTAYRERISDERLRAVSDYVRRWLFADLSPATGGSA